MKSLGVSKRASAAEWIVDDDQIKDAPESSEGSSASAEDEAAEPAAALTIKPVPTKKERGKDKSQFVCVIICQRVLLCD
jgi:hypothetical protein